MDMPKSFDFNDRLDLINNYWHREKQINVTDNYAYGVCTFIDKC